MSCNRFVEVWGSAAGPVRVLGPATRLATGGLLFASVLASDPATITGFLLILAIVSIWFFAVKPPRLLIGPLLFFAFTLFGPFFLMTPWVQTSTADVDLLIPMPVGRRLAYRNQGNRGVVDQRLDGFHAWAARV